MLYVTFHVILQKINVNKNKYNVILNILYITSN